MTLAIAMIAVSLVWLALRKWIAQLQYTATSQMFGETEELKDERLRGFERAGAFFCVVFLLGGLAILALTLIFRPPWEGS
ncbi:hypothetical protein AB4Y88_23300 [Paenarthrobacter sp. RAF9]